MSKPSSTSLTDHPLVLFDGYCNLCNSSVQLIIRNDKKAWFHFASLQSDTGRSIMEKFDMDPDDLKTFILYHRGKLYTRSAAALRVAGSLRFPYNLLSVFIVIPPFLRNIVYNWVARNRYRWFGRRESCMVPTPDIKARFHD